MKNLQKRKKNYITKLTTMVMTMKETFFNKTPLIGTHSKMLINSKRSTELKKRSKRRKFKLNLTF